MQEAAALVRALPGWSVVETLQQRVHSTATKTLLGPGQMAELKRKLADMRHVTGETLSPLLAVVPPLVLLCRPILSCCANPRVQGTGGLPRYPEIGGAIARDQQPSEAVKEGMRFLMLYCSSWGYRHWGKVTDKLDSPPDAEVAPGCEVDCDVAFLSCDH